MSINLQEKEHLNQPLTATTREFYAEMHYIQERLTVERVLCHHSDSNIISLYKIKRNLDELIKKHNDLIKVINHLLARNPEDVRIVGEYLRNDTKRKIQKPPVNDPRDAFDLLVQFKYYCKCVAPRPVSFVFPEREWCQECNRPIVEVLKSNE